jgi:hypothetical protein
VRANNYSSQLNLFHVMIKIENATTNIIYNLYSTKLMASFKMTILGKKFQKMHVIATIGLFV